MSVFSLLECQRNKETYRRYTRGILWWRRTGDPISITITSPKLNNDFGRLSNEAASAVSEDQPKNTSKLFYNCRDRSIKNRFAAPTVSLKASQLSGNVVTANQAALETRRRGDTLMLHTLICFGVVCQKCAKSESNDDSRNGRSTFGHAIKSMSRA